MKDPKTPSAVTHWKVLKHLESVTRKMFLKPITPTGAHRTHSGIRHFPKGSREEKAMQLIGPKPGQKP